MNHGLLDAASPEDIGVALAQNQNADNPALMLAKKGFGAIKDGVRSAGYDKPWTDDTTVIVAGLSGLRKPPKPPPRNK